MLTWPQARRVLCVRPDNLGDVLMTTPAMQALADSAPHRALTLLTSRASAALAPHLDMIDDVIAWDAPWVRHAHDVDASRLSAELAGCAARLAARNFDAAVIFTVYSQSALPAATLCSLAGIPLRLAHCRENPYALLTDWVPDPEPSNPPRHEVQRQLDLVASIGATTRDAHLRFALADADRHAVQRLLAPLVARHGRRACIVIHPGATAASRRWPADRFASVARELAAQAGALVLVTGSAAEAPVVDTVCTLAAHPAVLPMAGRFTLGEMGALLAAADLLVSNNSGPVHMAAALGTPVVDLYALTNPQHTPWMVPSRVLFQDVPCRYCYKSTCPQGHHRCLADVPARDVVAAAAMLLDGAPAVAAPMPWVSPAPRPALPVTVAAVPNIVKEDAHVHARH
ncbi:lipopolysaccharide heptosyltransferase II [Cupriavidus sp. H18C2]|uniref:lipopolysaccharide heptosyltransferase II n=1 Tax=Cupriavidus sp. H18C2 TaxID=3241602 RepID=UPI003BF8B0D0